ncbi:hypothetical protein [Flavobacterium sangjuense]|uniref:Uncharacterized protein n=1 Tax=Flavobacterium sangjuense TaxID=2518177 RepID=A0A4P7PRL3_9FLAO|nr:hypothetical protein [Flavobacterium sangjuense]QBZ96712.1 hypothetical protein GS03_00190 [Flavobacterium sangjuense]
MKKLILTFIFGAVALSCSSDSSGTSLSDTPDAKAQYDDSSFGIYKGVFVGSTGTVEVNVYNSGEAVATLTINGSSKTYTAAEKVAEDFAITGLTFVNGSNSFDFNVNGNGTSPSVSSINISGHANAKIDVIKELSNSLVKCYLGSFNGDSSGTFNIIIQGSFLYGLAKPSDDDSSLFLDGDITGNNILGEFDNGAFVGTVDGNRISGTWTNTLSESGSWSGNRKL